MKGKNKRGGKQGGGKKGGKAAKSEDEIYVSASVQLRVPLPTEEMIQRWSTKFISESMLYMQKKPNEPPLGRVSTSHITLKYGLREEDFDQVKKIAASTKAIKIEFTSVKLFPGKLYDVVVVGVKLSRELGTLFKKIDDLPNLLKHQRAYKPHCTIAYVKIGAAQYASVWCKEDPIFSPISGSPSITDTKPGPAEEANDKQQEDEGSKDEEIQKVTKGEQVTEKQAAAKPGRHKRKDSDEGKEPSHTCVCTHLEFVWKTGKISPLVLRS